MICSTLVKTRHTSKHTYTHTHIHTHTILTSLSVKLSRLGWKINETKILFIVQKSKGTFRPKVSVLDKGYNLFPRPHHKALLWKPVASPLVAATSCIEYSAVYSLHFNVCTGEVPSVLAKREIGALSVLRCRPDGWIQHAAVHSARIQDHGRAGSLLTPHRY